MFTYYNDLNEIQKAHVDSLAQRLHDYAEKHYNEGWDTFVECGLEYCREQVTIECTPYDKDFQETNWKSVKKFALSIISVWEDQRSNEQEGAS